jgi:hypothetical protein
MKRCRAGYCTESCTFGVDVCSKSSSGHENVCVPASAQGSYCQPSCESDEECLAIHPELTCWDYYDSLDNYLLSACAYGY